MKLELKIINYNKIANQPLHFNCKGERGQAIAEMCIGLIAIMVVFLGVIFIAGLGISNIKIYLGAKNNAEYASRNGNSISGAGSSIYSWNYGDYTMGDTTVTNLPFTANDQIIAVADNDVDNTFNTQITSGKYSQGEANGSYSYLPINALPAEVRNNFTSNLDSMFLAAADLVQSSSSYSESFYTLTSNVMGTRREINQLKINFGNLINIKINEIDLQQMRANQVYMPRLPVSESSNSGSSGGSATVRRRQVIQ